MLITTFYSLSRNPRCEILCRATFHNAYLSLQNCSEIYVSVTERINRHGGVVGVVGNTAVTVKLQNCVVNGTEDQKYKITGEETAGGMIGLSTAPNKKIQMKQCEVSNMKMISNKWGCGGMLGDVDWAANLDTLYLDRKSVV